ncbi:hypothetical protein E1287_30440 [Actinomadura sp. KC06]|uniref:DUF5941 domain-containing protein n=1 Tax=Actinomadura sp. KC06 TaxID=2530369 RepID=UPI001052FA3D|nr:DUF5941 domain-containing protein [Actinomadura sp. KC06]TDD29709.1 hypothetical protein E1287_30440 [Actinomadura sp. KC06]
MLQAPLRDRPVTLKVPDHVPDHPAIIRPDREVEAVDDGSACATTPDTVSAISLAFAVLAAVWFSDGTRGGLIAGALLLCASLVLGAFRPDGVLDRAGEFAVYAGLTAGAAGVALPGANLWWAATGAVALISVRDMVDASYAATRTARWKPSGQGASRRSGVLRRVGRGLGLPTGERLALVSITAAVAGARPTFAVLLAWCSAAATVVLAGRAARSLVR